MINVTVDISQTTGSWRGVYDRTANYVTGSLVEDAGGKYWRSLVIILNNGKAGAAAPEAPEWQPVKFTAYRLGIDPA
jgi:hypothetical protein